MKIDTFQKPGKESIFLRNIFRFFSWVPFQMFQAQSVLLNGKRAMNGADTVGAAQIGIAGKMIVSGKSAGQL